MTTPTGRREKEMSDLQARAGAFRDQVDRDELYAGIAEKEGNVEGATNFRNSAAFNRENMRSALEQADTLKADLRVQQGLAEEYNSGGFDRKGAEDKDRVNRAKVEAALEAFNVAAEEATLRAKQQGLDVEIAEAEIRESVARAELDVTRKMFATDKERTKEKERAVKIAEREAAILKATRKDAEEKANRKGGDLKKQNEVSEQMAQGNWGAASFEISEQKKAELERELSDVRAEAYATTGSSTEADKAVERHRVEMKEEVKAGLYKSYFESGTDGASVYRREMAQRTAAGMGEEKASKEATAAALAADPSMDAMDLSYEKNKGTFIDTSGVNQQIDDIKVRRSALESVKEKGGKVDMTSVLKELSSKIKEAKAILVLQK